jgi:hypothetical protein
LVLQYCITAAAACTTNYKNDLWIAILRSFQILFSSCTLGLDAEKRK